MFAGNKKLIPSLSLAACAKGGDMVTTTEIAPDVFRISVMVPEYNLEFSHFLVRDDAPLLFQVMAFGQMNRGNCTEATKASRTGSLMIGIVSYGAYVPYRRLKRATIAAEDAKFLDHDGFDWDSIAKAYEKNVKKGKIVSGGSTLTMQIARMLEPKERTYANKLREVLRALQLEVPELVDPMPRRDRRCVLGEELRAGEAVDEGAGCERGEDRRHGGRRAGPPH